MPRSRVEHCKEVVSQILDDVAVLLKDTEIQQQEQRFADFFRTVEMASRLSGTLSLQHPCIRYHFLHDLKEPRFRLGDDWFRTHRLLKLELDEHEDDENNKKVRTLTPEGKKLLGEPFDLIVAPAVVRFGDGEAENYDKPIVVFQGTSWIVKDKNSLTEEPAGSYEAPQAPAPGEPCTEGGLADSPEKENDARSGGIKAPAHETESTDKEGSDLKTLEPSIPMEGAHDSSPPQSSTQAEFEIYEDAAERETDSSNSKNASGELRKVTPSISSESSLPASELPIAPSSIDPHSVEATINTSTDGSATTSDVQEDHGLEIKFDGMEAFLAFQNGAKPKPPAEKAQPPKANPDKAPPKRKPRRSKTRSEKPAHVEKRAGNRDIASPERQHESASNGATEDTARKVSEKAPAKRPAPVIDLTDQADDVTNMDSEPKSKKQVSPATVLRTHRNTMYAP